MPLWVLGVFELALLTGVLRGSRLPHHGGKLVVGSLVLLVLPFIALPAGTSVARLAEITSENPSITLFFRSISTSLTVSIVAVLMAFPVAYYLAFCRGKSKYTWLVIVIAPFLTSYLLRVLAFKVILTDDGLVNTVPLRHRPARAGQPGRAGCSTRSSRCCSCCSTPGCRSWHCRSSWRSRTWTGGCSRRPPTSAPAACARSSRSPCRLAAPGIVAAFLFVFIPTIGEFVTPQLVGGSKGYLFGSAIADDFGQNSDWQSGAVLALFLMLVVLLLTGATSRFLRATGGGS